MGETVNAAAVGPVRVGAPGSPTAIVMIISCTSQQERERMEHQQLHALPCFA
jgi:hypothetical protein